jgi:hypothetical protein
VKAARARYEADGTLPPLHVGEHCAQCPALRYCPAQTAIVRQVATLDEQTIAERVVALSDEKVMELYEQADLVEKLAKAAKSAIKARASQAPGGLLSANGRQVLRECNWTTKKKSDIAKDEIAALTEDLERRGEIRTVQTKQVRLVAAPRAKRSAA